MATINIEYLPSINYSLINNGVAICQSVELCNDKADDLRDIIIECSGDFSKTFVQASSHHLRLVNQFVYRVWAYL